MPTFTNNIFAHNSGHISDALMQKYATKQFILFFGVGPFFTFLFFILFNFLFSFFGNAILKINTQFSLSLLYFCYSYCVSFCSLYYGVFLSINKRITYLLTYLHHYQCYDSETGMLPILGVSCPLI